MLHRALLFLSISSMASAAAEKTIPNAEQGKSCNIPLEDAGFFVRLGKKKASLDTCKSKCINDEFCEGIEYKAPRKCYLFYNTIDEFKDADEDTYCGRVEDVEIEDEDPTVASPSLSPTFDKEYVEYDAYTRCDVTPDKEKSTKINKYTSLGECQTKCSTVKKCKAYQWNGKNNSCIIFKYRLNVEDAVEVNNQKIERVCGIIKKSTTDSSTESPTASPTASPTTSPTTSPTKSPTINPTKPPTKNPTKSPTSNPSTSPSAPPVVEIKITESPSASPTESPTTSPTKSPIKNPSNPPTSKPSPSPVASPVLAVEDGPEPVECTLRVLLKFDFDTHDEASDYGYHADYMEVVREDDPDAVCSSDFYADVIPSWCNYENSSPGGDSAYIANLDDNYYDDAEETITSETIMISNAAGKTFEVRVSHWFFDKDYYPNLVGWDDHMMAALLKIKNMSSKDQNQLNKDGWSHPVDEWTPTHVDGEENPDYQGNFKVTVTCDDTCFCLSAFELVE